MEPTSIWDVVSTGRELTWGEAIGLILCLVASVGWMWWTDGEE